MHVIAQVALCWIAVCVVFATPIILTGYRGKLIRKMNLPRQLGDDARGDSLEGFAFSQGVHSVHNGGNAA